ncbi:transcriptional coactivator/pterin dehydratase [Aspergillus alliaceus]|uniref:4a-hydroxytetrahydrobiopterin dehydratase n=1 Tax=Petromyces alliaceus TaxID=209559 RepID=A0A5N7CHR3_PETAA|nr:transcriptional coactivator/pterin dehydratase [Aspergillus alliaceus]
MDSVCRAMQRPSRTLTLHLRRSLRQHHHRSFASASPIPIITSCALRSESSSLHTSITAKNSPTSSQYLRTFSHSSTAMAATPQFAKGMDASQLQPELDKLLEQEWVLDEDGMGVKKTYYFKTYFKAVSFVNVVASQSATKRHHPTMTVRIGSVDVHWTTHNPRGLTDKDLTMAQHCDEAAELMGAVDKEGGNKCGPSSSSPLPSPGLY